MKTVGATGTRQFTTHEGIPNNFHFSSPGTSQTNVPPESPCKSRLFIKVVEYLSVEGDRVRSARVCKNKLQPFHVLSARIFAFKMDKINPTKNVNKDDAFSEILLEMIYSQFRFSVQFLNTLRL